MPVLPPWSQRPSAADSYSHCISSGSEIPSPCFPLARAVFRSGHQPPCSTTALRGTAYTQSPPDLAKTVRVLGRPHAERNCLCSFIPPQRCSPPDSCSQNPESWRLSLHLRPTISHPKNIPASKIRFPHRTEDVPTLASEEKPYSQSSGIQSTRQDYRASAIEPSAFMPVRSTANSPQVIVTTLFCLCLRVATGSTRAFDERFAKSLTTRVGNASTKICRWMRIATCQSGSGAWLPIGLMSFRCRATSLRLFYASS